ncbi:hypothetical protein ACJJTC_013211 [Scirpophaga incertulas]
MSDSNANKISYLRQYRFQKKPNVPDSSSSSSFQIASSSNSPTLIRMAAPNAAIRNGPVVYKRIRVQDSDSDEPVTPIKKVAAPELTTAVKERRFKNMLAMFPDLSVIFVKNTLVKYAWNEERARDELLKHDPESDELNVRSAQPNTTYFSARPTVPSSSKTTNGNTGIIRVMSGDPPRKNLAGVVVRKVPTKVVRVRRGSSGSEDDDYSGKKAADVYDSDDSDSEISDDLIGDKKNVFEFLNTSKITELSQLSGCSQKKAELIISLRPFKGWVDMVEKFNSNKTLSTDLLNATQELLATRNNIKKLMKKCVGLAQQLEAAVAAGAGRLKTPGLLDPSLKLAPYQLVGLNWLAVLHKQGVSGILADEMGLGKTVQVIAFLAHLKETGQAKGTHLIVVPASTLDNWSGELERWCPSLRVSKYYGHPEERRQLRIQYARGLDKYDVVLTTYTMVSSCPEERKMFRITPMHYVVYDEAHMLKNMATQRYDNLLKIKSKHRLLLTGTPLQNNLLELMSLLCFVMPHMFSGKTDDLKSLFQKNSKAKTATKADGGEDEGPAFEQSQILQAKRIMKPFVLRRLKRDVLQDLPPKTNHTVLCAMAEKQKALYADLIAGFSATDGTVHATTEKSGMSMMMDMRKMANHPVLLRQHYTPQLVERIAAKLAASPTYKEDVAHHVYEDLLCLSDFQIHQMTQQHDCIKSFALPLELILESGKFQKLDEMLPRLKEEGHRVLLFSQFTMILDVLEPYLTARQHRYLRLDGSTAVTDRQELIDQYNASDIFVFLLSTRAGGLGINLTAADTVIIHDIDFNPYNDKQAEDRCHRLGQTRPVTIYRLLSVGTIEEGIFQVAQEKLNLEKHVTENDENETQEQKNVVRLLSAALGLTTSNK